MKNITLETLKELEAREYETLHNLSKLRYEYEKEGNPKADEVKKSEQWQQGRWGMLVDIIDELEEDED